MHFHSCDFHSCVAQRLHIGLPILAILMSYADILYCCGGADQQQKHLECYKFCLLFHWLAMPLSVLWAPQIRAESTCAIRPVDPGNLIFLAIPVVHSNPVHSSVCTPPFKVEVAILPMGDTHMSCMDILGYPPQEICCEMATSTLNISY